LTFLSYRKRLRMANVLTMRVTSNINGLPTQLRVVTVQKPIFCNVASSVLKTFIHNYRSSGDKDDYSVNISSTAWCYRPLPSPVRSVHLLISVDGCKFSSTFWNIYLLFVCIVLAILFCSHIYFIWSEHRTRCFPHRLTKFHIHKKNCFR
jgi:hypothetical protein